MNKTKMESRLGKSRKDNRGFTREQRLFNENNKLKKQIAQLRKQLARIDLDRYSHVRDIIEQHYKEDELEEGQDILDKIKQEWKCFSCNQGYLEIILYTRRDGTYYYRKCNCCTNRTKSQRYSEDVEGVKKLSDTI